MFTRNETYKIVETEGGYTVRVGHDTNSKHFLPIVAETFERCRIELSTAMKIEGFDPTSPRSGFKSILVAK